MIIDIIGTGISSINYDWNRDTIKWSVGSAFDNYKDNVDLYFCMHQGQSVDSVESITLESYPLKEIEEETGSKYFTNSIAYMIAYAIHINAQEINVFGVDVEANTEYAYERPCIAYWIAYAKGRGIAVNNASSFLNPPYLYGYDRGQTECFIESLTQRQIAYRKNAQISDGDKKQQWIGAMFATQKIIDLIRG